MSKGGKREGSGRKQLYGEKTIALTLKVPESKKKEIKIKFEKILTNYQTPPDENIQ